MTTSPISLAFEKSKREKRPALLTYTVAGDNNKKKSLEILNSISNHVDICELGHIFPNDSFRRFITLSLSLISFFIFGGSALKTFFHNCFDGSIKISPC